MYDCPQDSGNKRASVTVSYVDDGNKSWTDDWAAKPKWKLKPRTRELQSRPNAGEYKQAERIWYV